MWNHSLPFSNPAGGGIRITTVWCFNAQRPFFITIIKPRMHCFFMWIMTDQIAWMCCLIRVFIGHSCQKVHFLKRIETYWYYLHKNIFCGYWLDLSLWDLLTLVLLNPDMSCLCKQCRSRSVDLWRSQLIESALFAIMWIYINNLIGWKLEMGVTS